MDQAELHPPAARIVAERAMILGALACRGHLEHGAGDATAEEMNARLLEWLRLLDLWGSMDPAEKVLLESSLGTLSQRDESTAGWRAEGLLVVEWALGLADLIPHDTKADPFELTDALYFLHEDAGEIVEEATLRDSEDLAACRELYYAVHVRLREFRRSPGMNDCRQHFEAEWPHRLGLPGPLVGKDLGIQGRPISKADADAVELAEMIVHERHRAAIWLIGEEGPDYGSFGVDT